MDVTEGSSQEMCLDVPAEFPGPDVSETRSESSTATAVADVKTRMEACVQIMSQMRATSPDIVRGIPVHRFLQFAPHKWLRGDLHTLHAFSVAAGKLDEFWSHSWRTRASLKYFNILFLENGFPAFVVGTLCCFTAFLLCVAGVLPPWNGAEREYIWCTPAGVVGYYSTLAFLAAHEAGFPRHCLHQPD
ncbi:fam213a [Symbiodinium natans]|uniref:Fam213a protein n=1 Tax=Symbiodinium natans TaxID=878477 RepID=A0A812RB50_9DINO|nr:fam213a [Symbiodinium natans]